MAKDHRINIPVDQEMFDTANDMAEMMGISTAELVRQLIGEALPVLKEVTATVHDFREKEAQYLKEWEQMQEKAQKEFAGALSSLFPPPPKRPPMRSPKSAS